MANGIRHKGFEEFVPLWRRTHRWADRWKSVELPLFPGYVFCRLDPKLRLPILMIPGALNFIGIGHIPVAIEDAEIAAIQNVVRSSLPAVPWAFLGSGEKVRFERGPLAGLKGILIESRNGCRVVVSVTLLKRSVAVEVEREWLVPISEGALSGVGAPYSRPEGSSC